METAVETLVKDIRQGLKDLSQELKPQVEAGEFETINEAIIAHYSNETHKEFRLFNQWRAAKHRIIKGSKGFPVWTRPIDNQKITPVGEVDEYSFFGVCYLFSNAQVEPMI